MLEKLVLGSYFVNCYLVGSDRTKEIFVIDPGADAESIIVKIEELKARPIAILLTHAHADHTMALRQVKKYFDVPLWYNEKEYKAFIRTKADKSLNEGDVLEIDSIKLHVLETGGHSPGSVSIYTKDIAMFRGNTYDGVVFTGDLVFRRSVGRTDEVGCDGPLLIANIKNKIMHNPELTNNFLILAGHLGITTIGEERAFYQQHPAFGSKLL